MYISIRSGIILSPEGIDGLVPALAIEGLRSADRQPAGSVGGRNWVLSVGLDWEIQV
jgi:hypothetical protein